MCCFCIDRREFLTLASGTLMGLGLGLASKAYAESQPAADLWDPSRPFKTHNKSIKVQPVLMYATPQKREQTSWKSWGGVQTEESAVEEVNRIDTELKSLQSKAAFPIEISPCVKVRNVEDLNSIPNSESDVTLIYPATGSASLLRTCFSTKGDTLLFVRHTSGPVYYWYEALSTSILQKERNFQDSAYPVTVDDAVVDDYDELLTKLHAIHAVRNLLGTRIVAVGGAAGKYASDAPEYVNKKFGMEIIDVPYTEIEPRIKSMLDDPDWNQVAGQWADRYLAMPGTQLATDKQFVVNGFLLYALFRQIMEENGTNCFTIKSCMGTIMPMSKTTACLTLSLLNDEGLVAFCESDFVVIPAGLLLRHLSGKPVFMHNSTFPHKGIVTCAHCTSPRRLNGDTYEATKIVTHYESEYGAAPKVDIPINQQVTFVNPEYTTGRWVGFTGVVKGNPFYEICRSQQDVEIQGNWKRLIREVRDSHWMMTYGNHLNELGYAASKLAIDWDDLTTDA